MLSQHEEKKTRVLIADDDPDVLSLFSVLLNRDDLELETATDGREALQAISAAVENETPFHLLITDLMMPNLSGMELICELGRRKIAPAILAITGAGEDKYGQALAEEGIENVLYKPFEFTALNREVNRILQELRPEPATTAQ
ncbi:MAG: response regulator [Planctomycetota bacterium]|jgi:DNA-binding response OmpR family regulator